MSYQEGLKFTVLGSGSGGNCSLVEFGHTALLVDAGFSGRQIIQRLQKIGRSCSDLDAILLTHEHVDHTRGLKILAAKNGIPVYCNRLTAEFLRPQLNGYDEWKLFITGSSFTVGNITIDTFPVPHDAYDPVGFIISAAGRRLGFLTDLGYATHAIQERIRTVHALLLETNYDPELLRADTKRPWSVKQRIMTRHGHLSNDKAAELVKDILSENLKHIFLGHLSEDCNRSELARKAVQSALDEKGASHISLYTTLQDEPTDTLTLS
ncbi:MAG: MBL fold metallo-hydrolase [Verrucomicrobiota bacterium]